MSKKNIVYLLVLSLFSPVAAFGDHHESDKDDAPELWVTSIAPIGSSGKFAAATATGLLLRGSDVVSIDPADPTTTTKLYEHPAAIWCIGSTSDGKTLASVDYRGNLAVFDVASGKAKVNEKAFERWCQSMVISPDDKSIVAGNESGKILVWGLADNKIGKTVELDGHSVTGLAFAPDGKQLAATDGSGHVHLLSWPELEKKGKAKVSEETAWCVAYVDDGKNLLVGSSDRNLYRLEAKADAKPESVAKGSDWITEIAVSPDGQVAAGEVGGRLHFPSTGGTDSMDAKSGVWALCWHGTSSLLAGTRKHGIVVAGRSWKWATPAKKAEPKKEPEEKKPAEEKKPDAEKKPEEKKEPAKEDKPKADAEKADAKKADAKKADAEKPKDESKKGDK